MICPHCFAKFTPTTSEISSELGKRKSLAKTMANRENGKLGGWPKGKKRGPRKHPKLLDGDVEN